MTCSSPPNGFNCILESLNVTRLVISHQQHNIKIPKQYFFSDNVVSQHFSPFWSTRSSSVPFGPIQSSPFIQSTSVHINPVGLFGSRWSIQYILDCLGLKLILFVGCLFSFVLKNSFFYLNFWIQKDENLFYLDKTLQFLGKKYK